MSHPTVEMTFPVIETARFFLREFTPTDATLLVKHFGNPQAATYVENQPIRTREQANEWLKWMGGVFSDPRALRCAATLKGGVPFVGYGGLYNWNREINCASLDYNVLPDFRGKGFATEIASAIIEYGWQNLKLNRIEADVVCGNITTLHILEKLGFKREGTMRQRLLKGGKYYDVCLLGLLRSDHKSDSA